ncbi:alpha-1A adrenergic receptor [Denticeps clupeoides]|uniref:Alpha-1A adrenergic receptor n=1 Tax=Denticeps clupeoides TaxID=299321 RepID=A0AAY4EQJ1_9TELE|nr:alpha-1A adrenergic receptor-like [Denticeps clupeoides]
MIPSGENMTPDSLAQNCSNCSRPLEPELNVTKAVVLGLVLTVFMVFGVLGNILVILSVVCHRHLRTVTHYFIVNLAVADLLLSSTVLPFSATFEILGRWVFGRPFCDVWAAVDVLCCTASIMSLCAISVDRYIGVSYPLRYPAIVTERRALIALVSLWAVSVTISIGPLFGWKEPAPEDETVCKITEEPGYAIFSAVGSFYIPLVVILVMYCRVYVVARRETRVLKKGRKTERSDHASEGVTLRMHRGNTAVSDDEALRSRTHFALRLLKFSREKRAAKTLGIVVGCFVLCWLPFFLVLPIGSIFPSYRPSDTIFKITFWLGYFNSCINPIIYPCSSQEFKKAFLSVLGVHCLKRHTRPHHPFYHSQTPGHGQSHFLSLALEGRSDGASRLSPSSSIMLSRTPSSREGREWRAMSRASSMGAAPGGTMGLAGVSGGAKVAGVCGKNLLKTWCCVAGTLEDDGCGPAEPNGSSLPTIKIHQLSLCENGEPV